jgi:hypothetical protein
MKIELIYIGDHYYEQSRSMMSPIYTIRGERYDWGYIQIDLANGHEVSIRQATPMERAFYDNLLARKDKE